MIKVYYDRRVTDLGAIDKIGSCMIVLAGAAIISLLDPPPSLLAPSHLIWTSSYNPCSLTEHCASPISPIHPEAACLQVGSMSKQGLLPSNYILSADGRMVGACVRPFSASVSDSGTTSLAAARPAAPATRRGPGPHCFSNSLSTCTSWHCLPVCLGMGSAFRVYLMLGMLHVHWLHPHVSRRVPDVLCPPPQWSGVGI